MEIGHELQMKKGVNSKNFLLVPFESKKDLESLARISEIPNGRAGDSESSTSENDVLELSTSEEEILPYCQTPKDNIFDPFAPGPEELILAPKKKLMKETEATPRKQLIFELGDHPVKSLGSDDFDDTEEDDYLLEFFRKGVFTLVLSNQVLEAIAQNLPVEGSPPASPKTPTSLPLLTGISDTCPGAPCRPMSKELRLSPSICRKLDFEAKLLQDL